MPRQARLDVSGALHHIMIRGVNRGDLFNDKQDKQKFLERFGANVTKLCYYRLDVMAIVIISI